MKLLTSAQLRSMFLQFFKDRGHALISSASLIPENDPSVLFTMAGMHPLVPYLLGQKHPEGTRLVDVQKCIRTDDINDVGDASHLTFFEMLGNWSLGDYFKKEMIPWSWEFLTSGQYLGIPKDKLAFSVFAGDENAPRDEESAALWRGCGVPGDRIFFLPKENNWWAPGAAGPCGPDSEMFIITDKEPCGADCSPACSCGRYLEIWNDVFMQYNRTADGTLLSLAPPNVDTGMGLERTLCVLTGKTNVYETDLFENILSKSAEMSGRTYTENKKAFRIVADHMRTATFILGDDRCMPPSNTGQGYVLRRLIRRAVRYGMELRLPEGFTGEIARVIIRQYKTVYPELSRNGAFILEQLSMEETRFAKTLDQGTREFEKIIGRLRGGQIDGISAFHLYDTYGFPVEMTVELAKERGLTVDMKGYEESFKEHQEKSHAGADQVFKGGLADHSGQTTKLHTATHLLHKALRKVLGDEVAQKGSNITAERLRFDFSFGRRVTPEELAEVEKIVNGVIAAAMPVTVEEMTVDEAKEKGAIGLFESRYGEKVKVYTIGNFSKEICGGPHVLNTAELGSFKIQKEESSSAGVRRIKAVVS